jgi:hypothetical protein
MRYLGGRCATAKRLLELNFLQMPFLSLIIEKYYRNLMRVFIFYEI